MVRERRRVARIHPPGNLLLIFDCDRSVIGQVHTISRLGVSVEYEDGVCRPQLDAAILIRIVDEGQPSDPAHALRCIPVYDIPTLSHHQTFKGRQMRLFGMRYADLNPANRQRIHRLMESSLT